jgi:hypothetical protein
LYTVIRLLKVIEGVWSVDREPLLFVRGDTHAESNRSCMERRSGALCFLYAAMHVLKAIEAVWSVDRGTIAFYMRRCAC